MPRWQNYRFSLTKNTSGPTTIQAVRWDGSITQAQEIIHQHGYAMQLVNAPPDLTSVLVATNLTGPRIRIEANGGRILVVRPGQWIAHNSAAGYLVYDDEWFQAHFETC